MIITPLGHTEFLIDIANPSGETVRILVDSWLSDYAVGDMMERTVRVELDTTTLTSIDAIYISHAHCDHFDPYILMQIYGETLSADGAPGQNPQSSASLKTAPLQRSSQRPILILPFTLRYLESLIREYLPSAEIHFLSNHHTLHHKGIEITGHMYPNPEITNEDDVMMLEVANEREMVFAEIDTVPDMEDETVARALYRVFTRKSYETACYIASRNALEGQIPLYDTPPAKRKAYRDTYIAEQKESMKMQYEKYDYEEFAHFPNLYTLPGFVQGYIGQGIAYPRSISAELADMAIWPLEEMVSVEQDYAREASYEFSQKALLPGRQYRIEGGTIETGRKECPIARLIKPDTHSPKSLSDTPPRIYAHGPLFPRVLSDADISAARERILDILDHRFLTYWSASPIASLRDALIRNNGIYRIGCTLDDTKYIFEYSTGVSGFREVAYESLMYLDEEYYVTDIIDFLEGRQEMYSSFWHALDPKKVYRLWTCLGANYMNHDIALAKYRLHFERARAGLTAADYVTSVLDTLTP